MKVAEKHEGYNSILEKSFAFSVRIVKFYIYELKKHRDIEPLLKQVLKSGTSIGANISEAQEASSKKDFINNSPYAKPEN
jgi:four helix bundle protein